MSIAENSLAREAASIVEDAGGRISFDEFDKQFTERNPHPIVPLHWARLAGLRGSEKIQQAGVLSAFAAVEAGLIEQVDGAYQTKSTNAPEGNPQ